MMSQERVLLALQHKEADRVPIFDQPWTSTVERWHREGLPEDQSPADYFGFDIQTFAFDRSLQLEIKVIEETADYVIKTWGDGVTIKVDKHTSGLALLAFTVTSRDLWEEYKPRMTWNDSRVDWGKQRKRYDEARSRGLFCCPLFLSGFLPACDMVGPERLMVAMLEDPEWVKDMFMTDAGLCVTILEEMMARGFDFDAGWLGDDLGYKNTSLISPAMYRELVMPAHKLICDCFKSRGKPMLLHSDGNVSGLIPLFIEAGFDCLQPLEAKAGMDLVELKKAYGDRLALFGGIDARDMADPDPAVIEREIASKVPIAKQGGGYLFHSDHSVPDNVSFQQFCRVMELAAKYGKF